MLSSQLGLCPRVKPKHGMQLGTRASTWSDAQCQAVRQTIGMLRCVVAHHRVQEYAGAHAWPEGENIPWLGNTRVGSAKPAATSAQSKNFK